MKAHGGRCPDTEEWCATNQGRSLQGQMSGGADGCGDEEQARILDPAPCVGPGKMGVTVPTPSAALRLG